MLALQFLGQRHHLGPCSPQLGSGGPGGPDDSDGSGGLDGSGESVLQEDPPPFGRLLLPLIGRPQTQCDTCSEMGGAPRTPH